MTFRKNPDAKGAKRIAKLDLADFEEGQKVVAVVKKVEMYGMFLRIEDSNVSGLCHKSEVSRIVYEALHANSFRYPMTRKRTSVQR